MKGTLSRSNIVVLDSDSRPTRFQRRDQGIAGGSGRISRKAGPANTSVPYFGWLRFTIPNFPSSRKDCRTSSPRMATPSPLFTVALKRRRPMMMGTRSLIMLFFGAFRAVGLGMDIEHRNWRGSRLVGFNDITLLSDRTWFPELLDPPQSMEVDGRESNEDSGGRFSKFRSSPRSWEAIAIIRAGLENQASS
ncbi:hypothetical protein F4810DRAFT_55005 [Camillea tinctor]|nr:hypothetical protein F4810DRAFT_55005 [Camillea tinctor]